MSSRWTGFFIWALVAACAAFWGLKIFAATRPVPAGAQAPQAPVAVAGPMVRLFGAAPVAEEVENAPSPTSDRFQLVGVIAPRANSNSSEGIAIVSVDNQPAKAWHVGGAVEGETTLLAVAKRAAEFGPKGGPTAFTLELPEPAPPETGTLPPPVSQPVSQGLQQVQPGVNQQRANMQARPNAPFQVGRPGTPINPALRLGAMPGQVPPPNAVPPGRTPPMPGQAPAAPAADTQSDEE